MKHHDSRNPKKKSFLRIPTYPGGKNAYLKFIQDNLIYPEPALLNKVEGLVYIVYTVNNIGEIVEAMVTKGIGSGCDEEAIRVIRLLEYEPARNRGVKMKVEMKTRIHFKLPENLTKTNKEELQINYTTTSPTNTDSPEPKPQAAYYYTINIS